MDGGHWDELARNSKKRRIAAKKYLLATIAQCYFDGEFSFVEMMMNRATRRQKERQRELDQLSAEWQQLDPEGFRDAHTPSIGPAR